MNKTIRLCILLTSCFFALKSWAQPTMSAPTVTGITHNSAVLGGTIAGTGITARGTAWKTSSPVISTDNQLAEGGTTAGTYTHTRSSLPSGTQIFFVAYGTDAGGTAISAESSFYTLSAPPSGQPATFTATTSTANNETEIDLTFSAASSVSAAGYLIYRRSGATNPNITAVNLPNAALAPASLGDGSTLVTTISTAASTSFTDTGLIAGTQYSYSIVPFGYNGSNAATYNYLIASYKSANAFTVSTVPDNQPGTVTANAVSKSQINLTFTDFATLGNSNGYVILRRVGAAPATTSVQDGIAPASLVLGASTLVTTVTVGGTTSFNNTGLTSGTDYHYAVVPFNWNGVNPETYNYKTGGGFTVDNDVTFFESSTITLNGGTQGGTSSTGIDYINFQTPGGALTAGGSANSVSLAEFRINDLGGTDGVGTILTSLTFSMTNFANVSKVGIFDGNTNIAEQTVSSGTITFNSLNIFTSNNGNKDFQLRATFNSTVTDNQQINITITAATASSSGSDFGSSNAGGAATSNANAINVIRTKLVFSPAGPINTTANVNFGPITVLAQDALNNFDANAGSTVTLGLTPSGTVTSTPASGSNMTSGQIIFNPISIGSAGNFTMTATYGAGSPSVSNATMTVNVTSPGVSVTAGTLPLTPCYNGNFQTLSNIVITEFDNADFAVGNNVSFSLLLPPNFIFDNTFTSAPTSTGAGISGISALSYIATDGLNFNIVQFRYTTSAGSLTAANSLIISGLRIKYIGMVDVSNQKLRRLGGSAVQAGNADTDNRDHGILSAQNSSTPVSFSVQELSGNPTVNPGETRFSSNAPSVKLIGSPSGGVFSGNGVTFSSAQSSYIFSPSTVGIGSYTITYLYTEVGGQQCQIKDSKQFIVSTGVINNLATQYCTNGAPATGLSVTQAQIDAIFPPANSHVINDFVYYSPAVGSYIPISPVNTTFDPTLPDYLQSQNTFGAVYVYYRVRRVSDNLIFFAQLQLVNIFVPPVVTLNLPVTTFCVDAAPINLSPTTFASPAPSTISTNDFFTATGSGAPAVSYIGGNTWRFNPSLVTNASSSQQSFNLTYTFKNTTTNCSSTSAVQVITVNPRPSPVSASSISPFNSSLTPDNTIFTCQGTSPSAFSATPVVGTSYRWYTDAALTDLRRIGNAFVPVIDISTPGTTNFYVTRTINGCESNSLILAATVKQNVTVEAGGGPSATICADSFVDLVALNPSISGAVTTGTWSVVIGTGAFLDASNNPVGIPSFGVARRFRPALNQTSVRLRLTSSIPSTVDPNNPCAFDEDDVVITINPIATANAGLNQQVCANSAIVLNGSVGGAATSGIWSQVPSSTGIISSPTSLFTSYTPTAAEISNGALLTFRLTTNDPTGPCSFATSDVTITIFPLAVADAGISTAICANSSVDLTSLGASISGAASTASWSSSSIGGVFETAGGSSNNVFGPGNAARYIISSTDIANGGVTLKLVTNDPSGPCGNAADDVFIPINAIAISIPGSYAPVCAGTPIQLSGAVAGSATSGTWTTNGQGTFNPPGSTSTATLNPAYIPSNAELQAGASITMTLTTNDPDGSGPCTAASQNTIVTINAAPPAVFTVPSVCKDVPVTFDGPPSPPGNAISSWKWNFGDGTTGSGQSVVKTYTTSNQFSIQLSITGVNGCVTNSDAKTVVVGLNPIPVFNFFNTCEGEVTRFESATTNIPVEQYKWEFGDGDILGQDFVQGLPDQSQQLIPNGTHGGRTIGNFQNPRHEYAALVSGASDDYSVRLTVFTNLGCQGSILKTVRVLKLVSPTPTSFYDMKSSDGGAGFWSVEPNVPNSSWAFADLNKNVINAPERGWVTNPDKLVNNGFYNSNEESSVNSPCFNLSAFEKPAISINYWLDTQENIDGGVLQSSIDGGRSWQNVGQFQNNISSGLNWYNKQALDARPAGQSTLAAWSRDGDSKMTLGKHSLSDLPFKTDTIRFRLAFGSNNITEREGIAFNNVTITERNKLLLLENFTNGSISTSAFNNSNSSEIVKIQYHSGFPSNDAIYELNPSENSARLAFYGINSNSGSSQQLIPSGYVDGSSKGAFGAPFSSSWQRLSIEQRSLFSSPFKIAIQNPSTTEKGVVVARVSVQTLTDVPLSNLRLFIAIVEKTVGSNSFVMRKLLPSAVGVPISTPRSSLSSPVIVNEQWVIAPSVNPANLAIVAFIQNIESREVLQAEQLSNPQNLPSLADLVTGTEPDLVSLLSFYPIPADKELVVSLPEVATQNTPLVMYDAVGKAVHETAINKGQQSKTLYTQDFAPGVYLIQLETDKGVVRKKVMVVH
jgi:hypothetical protein